MHVLQSHLSNQMTSRYSDPRKHNDYRYRSYIARQIIYKRFFFDSPIGFRYQVNDESFLKYCAYLYGHIIHIIFNKNWDMVFYIYIYIYVYIPAFNNPAITSQSGHLPELVIGSYRDWRMRIDSVASLMSRLKRTRETQSEESSTTEW